nr:PilZ domain-containing protein [Bosea sp. PAMC 26642]
MTERRNSPRLRTFLGGHIRFNRNNSTLDCMVRNLSDNGALLQLSDAVALPHAFELEILHRERCYPARVQWRDGQRIGIAFAQAAAEASEVVPLDIARRLKQSEQDNARLKNRIRQLTEAG